jgi:hypothetical protein
MCLKVSVMSLARLSMILIFASTALEVAAIGDLQASRSRREKAMATGKASRDAFIVCGLMGVMLFIVDHA